MNTQAWVARARSRQWLRRIGPWVNLPALSAVMIWGASAPIGKYALNEFPAFAYIALRPLIAAGLLFAVLLARGERVGVDRRDWPRLLVAGFGGMASFQLLIMLGLWRTSAGHNALLSATAPLIGAVILWLLGRERLGRFAVVGLALGFAGVLLLLQGNGDGGSVTLLGDLLTLASAVSWVAVTLVPAPLIPRYGATRITAWMVLCTGVVALALGLPELTRLPSDMPPLLAWLAMLYSAILGLFVANTLWQRAVHVLGSTQTLVYVYLQPVLAVLLAALLLGERLGPLQALGGLIALAGVGLVRR